MARGWIGGLALWMALAAPAWAQSASEPVVRRVEFAGEVTEVDRLQQLLTLKTGQPYSGAAVRESMDLFYQKGLFRNIRVDRRPEGDGVVVTFTFDRQVLLSGWEFSGNRNLDGDILARTMDLTWGQALVPERFRSYAAAVHERYQREGFLNASTSFKVVPDGPFEAKLRIEVEEGRPLEVGAVRVLTPGPFSERDVLGALGVKVGDRLRRDAWFQGLERLEQKLTDEGYLNSRVFAHFLLPDGTRLTNFSTVVEANPERVHLMVGIEPGTKGLVSVEGDPLLPTKTLSQAVTVYRNRSFSPAELDASADALRQAYVSAGYPEAKVAHSVTRQDDGTYRIAFVVTAGPRVRVKAIEFVGNRGVSADTLQKVVSTQPATRILGGGAFDPGVWEEDLEHLAAYYETQGFLEAKILKVERLANAENELTLVVHLQEGPQTRIGRLLFTGVNPIHEAGILQSLPLNPGDPYNPRRLGEYLSSVEAYFAKSGYPLARVTAKIEPGETTADSALRFTVAQGPRKKLGNVVFRGNVKTIDPVVRRQLTVEPGQWYNSEELLRTQQQVYQLGFFDRVNIRPLMPISDNPAEAVDLLVELQERETGWVGFGGGFGDLYGFQASAEFQQNNLWGTGRPLRLEGIASLQRTEANFSLRDPYLFGSDLIGESGFTYLRDARQLGLVANTYGPTLGLSRQLSPTLLGSVRYTWTRTNYSDYRPEDLIKTGGLTDYSNGIVTGGVTYDTRSDLLNPKWGSKADLNLDIASRLLGGSLTYTRPRLALAHYLPVTRRIVLAVGAELGYISSFGENAFLPNDILFLAGGANSIRGYNANDVAISTGRLDTNGKEIKVGGQGLVVTHIETRFPVWGDVGGVVFVDAGNVWATAGDIGFGDLKVTTGLGVRYYTPIGPLRVDYGLRLRPTVEHGAFHFGIGHAF